MRWRMKGRVCCLTLLVVSGWIASCGSSGPTVKLPRAFTACIARTSSLTVSSATAPESVDVKDRSSGSFVGKVEVFASNGAAATGFSRVRRGRGSALQLSKYVVYTTATASRADSDALLHCADT